MEKQALILIADDTDHGCRKIHDSLFVFGLVETVPFQFFPCNAYGFPNMFFSIGKRSIFQQVNQRFANDFAPFLPNFAEPAPSETTATKFFPPRE